MEAKGAVAEQSNLVVDAPRETVGDAFVEDREIRAPSATAGEAPSWDNAV